MSNGIGIFFFQTRALLLLITAPITRRAQRDAGESNAKKVKIMRSKLSDMIT